jgi:uncharacterized metal-binding protein
MSIEAALAIALLVTCLIAFGICAFARWHRTHYLRVPYWQINEHRVTPLIPFAMRDQK